MVEADPVHSIASTARVAVALLYAPLRRPMFRNKAQGVLHRRMLPFDAARLPLAIDADVERDGIANDRRPPGGGRSCK